MNELDQFMKHKLKVGHYVRYTDDFMIMSDDRRYLESLLPRIGSFLKSVLALDLHPKKITLRPFHQGIDFLGYVMFPHHRLIRTKTRRRMFKKLKAKIVEFRSGAISEDALNASLSSYLGVLSHANTIHLAEEMENLIWFWG